MTEDDKQKEAKLLMQVMGGVLSFMVKFTLWEEKHGPINCCQLSNEMIQASEGLDDAMIQLLMHSQFLGTPETRELARMLKEVKDKSKILKYLNDNRTKH